jgi:NAD(P)H-hydrate epimerase
MDRRTIEDAGVPGYTLMQRAAAAAFESMQQRWPIAERITVLCGAGSNGGDGFEIARLAKAAGLQVDVWQFGISPPGTLAARARDAWLIDGGLIGRWPEFGADLRRADVIVDAIFGTGLSRAPSPDVVQAIEATVAARAHGAGVLAIDIPSGVMADTGTAPGAAITADQTVTFIGNKLGLHIGQGPEYSGTVVFDRIGTRSSYFEGIEPQARLMDVGDLRSVLPRRARDAHKGSNGHVLIIGGDHGMAGAVLLAARGALRAGAGLVTVATRGSHAAALTATQPEIMFRAVEGADDLEALLARATVVAIGPGLGQQEWGSELWRKVRSRADLVVDADALNLLAQDPLRNDQWVLTPHPGEAARLLGGDGASSIQANRLESVKTLRARFGGVAVLKGAGTLIAGEGAWLCPYGNPGMAVGGMGDVLCGIIAALRAQGLAPEQAASAGVLAHALAGDRAAVEGERGLAPTDLLNHLRWVVNPA